MTKESSARLSYALVLSILLVMIGFLGLGIRAFTSAAVSDFIYFVACGVFLTSLTIYFVLRRPRAGAASGQKDRRRPLAQGQERVVVAHERRSKQLAGFHGVSLELNASKTLRA